MPDRPPSPFRPGMGLDPPYLGDRGEQLTRFREFLSDRATPHNLLVTGLRGVGKTVLLNRYSHEAEAAGWLVAEREFSDADAEPSAFAQALLADLVRLTRKLSLTARLQGAAEKAVAAVLDHLGNLTVSYSGLELGIGVRRAASVQRRLDDDLQEAFEQVGDLCRRGRHPGFILRYDEFHVVQERRGQRTLSALLAATAAVQQRRVPLMLVLCGLPTLVENLSRAKSYSERMFQVEELGNLDPPEDRLALTEPARRAGRAFEERVVDAVVEDTAGYPFFIQLYGDALWKGSSGELITWSDFRRLRPRILQVLDRGFFEARFARAAPKEREVLRAIAEFGERATLADVLTATGLKNNQLQPFISDLIRKGFIYRPARGELAFTAPLFGAHVRRRPR